MMPFCYPTVFSCIVYQMRSLLHQHHPFLPRHRGSCLPPVGTKQVTNLQRPEITSIWQRLLWLWYLRRLQPTNPWVSPSHPAVAHMPNTCNCHGWHGELLMLWNESQTHQQIPFFTAVKRVKVHILWKDLCLHISSKVHGSITTSSGWWICFNMHTTNFLMDDGGNGHHEATTRFPAVCNEVVEDDKYSPK